MGSMSILGSLVVPTGACCGGEAVFAAGAALSAAGVTAEISTGEPLVLCAAAGRAPVARTAPKATKNAVWRKAALSRGHRLPGPRPSLVSIRTYWRHRWGRCVHEEAKKGLKRTAKYNAISRCKRPEFSLLPYRCNLLQHPVGIGLEWVGAAFCGPLLPCAKAS